MEKKMKNIISFLIFLTISINANSQINLLSNGTFDSSLEGWLGSGIWEPNDGGPSSGPGSGKTSTSLIKINWNNPLIEKSLALYLTEESIVQKRWRINYTPI